MSDHIIVVEHAEKRFGEQVALRDVSVSFEAGKIHIVSLAEMALEKRCFSNAWSG